MIQCVYYNTVLIKFNKNFNENNNLKSHQIEELYLKLLAKNRNRLRMEQREKLQVAWRKGQVSFSRTEER